MKRLLSSLFGLSALLLGSCAREIPTDVRIPADKRLSLSVQVEDHARQAQTRASVAPEEGEQEIQNLYLLFFEPTADRSGRYLEYVEVEMPEAGNMTMNVDTEIDLSNTGLTADNAYNILAVANVADRFYVDTDLAGWMARWSSKTEGQVMAEARGTLPTAISNEGLLMHGRMEKPAGETQAHLLLERNTVRFDVVNQARQTYDLVTVSIWNAYTGTSIWDDGITDYSTSVERMRRHYGISNEGNPLDPSSTNEHPVLGDVKGGLYTLPNQVTAPQANDTYTTCLIVGLRDRSSGEVTYYRVNMLSEAGTQILQNNYDYRLTITGVAGPGAPDEEIAYLGESNKLLYTLGKWQLDDNGLVVQDEHSILSIPTKTVNLGGKAQTAELSIHTFSTLASPAPLSIRSQTYRPVSDDIRARLDGNTLIIEASALALTETERNGVIVLSFAGLETAINVVQSGKHDDFLNVTLPDGGIPSFPAYSGIASGLITVEASAPWTAKLYLDGFTFNPSTAIAPVKEIKSSDMLVVNDPATEVIKKFRIYTHSFNTGQQMRRAFIVIEMDKDPERYSSVVRLSQTYVKQIIVEPAGQGAMFNGPGNALVNLPGNTDTFTVKPGRDDATGVIIPWSAYIATSGTNDDRDQFELTVTYDADDEQANKVVVRTKGINISGREYKATLRVQTDPGTFADIPLGQQPLPLKLQPAVINTIIPAAGGQSIPVTVDTDPSLKWKAAVEMISGTSSDGRRLVHHKATLVDQDGNPLEEGVEYPATTQFRVNFPKVYFPNRGIDVAARVKVSVGTQAETITVSQDPLTSRPVNVYSNTSTGRASLFTSDYNQYGLLPYATAIDDNDAVILHMSSEFPASANFLHRTNNGMTSATSWQYTNRFIANNDGVFTLAADYIGADPVAGLNRFSDDWRFNDGRDGTAEGTSWSGADTKVYDFILNRVDKNYNQASDGGDRKGLDTDIHEYDGISTHATSVPGSATTIIQTSNGNGLVVIDPKSRVVYSGELTIWSYRANGAWKRVWYYVAYTAKYGSAFSDLLIEQEDGGQPAPWDSYWDDRANGGTDNREEMFSGYGL